MYQCVDQMLCTNLIDFTQRFYNHFIIHEIHYQQQQQQQNYISRDHGNCLARIENACMDSISVFNANQKCLKLAQLGEHQRLYLSCTYILYGNTK